MSDRWSALRSDLDGLDQTACRALQHLRFVTQASAAALQFQWTPVIVMGFWVVAQVLSRATQSEFLRSHWSIWLVAALGVYALRILLPALTSRMRKVDRAHAIGEWDLQLDLDDRLTAADTFLQHDQRSAFMEAAVEDAADAIEFTRHEELCFATPRQKSLLPALPFLATLVLLVCGSLAGTWKAPIIQSQGDVRVQLPDANNATDALPEFTHQPLQDAEQDPVRQQETTSSEQTAVAEARAYASEAQEKSKESEGKTGHGRSAAAESSTGAGNSQGTPSQQGQISKPGKEKTKAKRKQTPPQKTQLQSNPLAKNEEQESGATAGRGSSRGSNRNPASSEWASKDHVNTPDDDNLEDEEDTQDEEEEQEARGGMQPSLRDRRPPVSRDLMIGFGNQPNPDANGRGGPSQPKKSRGTASLVLGVPIPDRIKGQPNPGKTKITQERVQPKFEPGPPIRAETRQQRQTPGSPLQRQELEPWMRSLVRDYFLAQRQKANKP